MADPSPNTNDTTFEDEILECLNKDAAEQVAATNENDDDELLEDLKQDAIEEARNQRYKNLVEENRDEILKAFSVTEGVLQKYISYVCTTPLTTLFTDIDDRCMEFKKSDGSIHKLKLDIVPKDYVFDLEVCDAEVVRGAMSFMLKSLIVVYPYILNSIDVNRVKEPKYFENSRIIIDPSNTTAIMYSPKHGKEVRDMENRIGFIWSN